MDENTRYDYKKQLNAEIEKRINEMEQTDYSFPARFQKRSYILWIAVIVTCLSLVICGAYL